MTTPPNRTQGAEAGPNVDIPEGEQPIPPPSVKELIVYSLGSSAVTMSQGVVGSLNLPVFNMIFGLSPGILGTIAGVISFWSALLDPVIGQLSDTARTRWGRRLPFILLGGILTAALGAAYFYVGGDWSSTHQYLWFGGFLLLFNTVMAVFSVPYYALGIELGSDYNQRTRVVAYRSVMEKLLGILGNWYFRIAEFFPSVLIGGRWLSGIAACLGIGATVAMVSIVKERQYARISHRPKNHDGFFKTIVSVLGNPVYLRLLFIWTILTLNMGIFGGLGLYLNIYYVYGGNMAAGATLGGAVGTLGLTLSGLAIPLTKILCDRWGKHRVLILALWLYIVGSVLKWWCVNPTFPWLQLVLPFFFSVGISSIFIVMAAMQADVVDYDELRSGKRREGMFGAIGGWIMKLGAALAVLCSGWVIVLTGFDVKYGGDQSDGVFFAMRLCFSIIPAVGCSLALLFVRNWPLTRARCEEIRHELNARRSASTL